MSALPPKIEPTSVLLRSFVSVFSKAFLAEFRSGLLEEIVECLGWLLLGYILVPVGTIFVPRGYILSASCRSGVGLGSQERVLANICKKHTNETNLAAQLGVFWDSFGDSRLLKSSRQAFCCTSLGVSFRECFSQNSEAGFQRKLLSPGGVRCVFEVVKT